MISPWEVQQLKARWSFANQLAPDVLNLCTEVERLQAELWNLTNEVEELRKLKDKRGQKGSRKNNQGS